MGHAGRRGSLTGHRLERLWCAIAEDAKGQDPLSILSNEQRRAFARFVAHRALRTGAAPKGQAQAGRAAPPDWPDGPRVLLASDYYDLHTAQGALRRRASNTTAPAE